MMDFYINFTLDEEFNETVQSPIHEDFSYSSFSEGLTVTGVVLFAMLKYNQIPNLYGTIGIILIIVGVVMVNYLGKLN